MTDKIKEALTGHWGERCEDYAQGCPCCDAWAELDALLAEVTRLTAELATARDDALEEAAAAVGEIPCNVGDTNHYWKCQESIQSLKSKDVMSYNKELIAADVLASEVSPYLKGHKALTGGNVDKLEGALETYLSMRNVKGQPHG